MAVMTSTVPIEVEKVSLASRFVRNASSGLRALTLLIYGPSGLGKSTSALKLSRHCPDGPMKVVPIGTTSVVADDMLVFSYDKDGMLSGLPFGLDVPVININDIRYELGKDVIDRYGNTKRELLSMRELHRQYLFPLLQEAYQAGCRNFVFDTLSSMISLAQPEIEAAASTPQGRNNLDFWTSLNTFAQEFYSATSVFPGATVLYLGHAVFKEDFVMANKALGESKQEAEEKARKKKETIDPYLSKVTLAMPGKTGEIFMNQSSLVLALKLGLNAKKNEYERTFVVNPGETEHRTKNRFADWLSAEEPADLRALINKIKTRAGQTI